MSTRATYEIDGTTFYCHCDGYPSGAAAKLANMIGALTKPASAGGVSAIADRRGGATFAFIRGNDDAEPTESHQAHGDTEHRWRVTTNAAGMLLVAHQARGTDFDHWGAWSTPEPIAGFINRHYPGAVVAIESPDPHWKRELVATTELALAIANRELAQAAGYQDGNPNKARHQAHAVAWVRGVLEQLPKRVAWLERTKAELAAELAKNASWGRAYYEREIEETGRELEALRAPIGDVAELGELVDGKAIHAERQAATLN